jgi:hypothetical protein
MAFRVLAGLALICGVAGIVLLLFFSPFSSVIVLAVAVVFALGAVVARSLKPSGRAAQ